MEPVILEISSDEEDDWLSELLDRVNREADDFDDVVVLDDNISYTSTIQKQKFTPFGGTDSDDDCLILDGDPDNPVAVVDDAGNGTDDLLIVGEKGQLACRDYPHPRHLCAKFPFTTTPHNKHCDLCHCYVCDLHAPCIYWGNGVFSRDHCHATDKEEIWTVQRKRSKQGNIAEAPSQKNPDTTLSMTLPNCTTESTLPFPGSLSAGLSYPLQAPVSKSRQLQACSTGFGVPNIISHRHNQRSRPIPRIKRYPNGLQQLTHGRHAINRERGGGSTVCLQPVDSHPKFKRVGPVGSPGSPFTTVNQSGYGPSNSLVTHVPAQVTQLSFLSPQVTHREDIQTSWQDLLASIDSSELDTFPDSFHPYSNSSFTDSQLHAHSQAFDQSSQLNVNQSMNQYGNPTAPNATNPDLLDNNFNSVDAASNTTPQYIPASDPVLPSVQPSGPSVISQAHSASAESWMYSLDHQPVPGILADPVLSELDFDLPEPAIVDLTMIFELGVAADSIAQ